MFWEPTPGTDGVIGTADDGTQATTYLSDCVETINEVITLFASEPLVYFVMLGLVAGSVMVVKGLVPTKRG